MLVTTKMSMSPNQSKIALGSLLGMLDKFASSLGRSDAHRVSLEAHKSVTPKMSMSPNDPNFAVRLLSGMQTTMTTPFGRSDAQKRLIPNALLFAFPSKTRERLYLPQAPPRHTCPWRYFLFNRALIILNRILIMYFLF